MKRMIFYFTHAFCKLHHPVFAEKVFQKINLSGKILLLSWLLLASISCFSKQPERQAMRADRVYAPFSQTGKDEIILEHKAYRLSFNPKWHIANWVAYELTREELINKVKRKNSFRPDPLLGRNSAVDADYRRSGYDRGHLAPSADMRYDLVAQMECFYFSNICPQSSKLNSVRWNQLEMKVREWAARDSALIVITGPVVKAGYQTIGASRLAVPAQFFKIVLALYAEKPKCIAFLMNNSNEREPLSSYAVSIDSIEKITGIDFFPVLPDKQEEALESKVRLNNWIF